MKRFVFILFLLFTGCSSPIIVIDNNKVLELHNEERIKNNINILELNSNLCKYAQDYSDYMALKNKLVHSNMSELMKFAKTNIVGENIACGQKDEKEVVSIWMRSPGHKKNILNNNYKQMGCGVTKGKNGILYWCVVFSD